MRKAGAISLTMCFLALVGEHFISKSTNRGVSLARALLMDSLGPYRFTEGRIVGELHYAPYDSARRRPPRSLDERKALINFRQDLREKSPSRQGLADHALVKLLSGRAGEAVESLELLVAQAPDNEYVLADVSAAYLARFRSENRPADLVHCLSAAERALKISPQLETALFNRAISLELLSLLGRAREAWLQYLVIDGASEWASEARQRLASIESLLDGRGSKDGIARLLDRAGPSDVQRLKPMILKMPWQARIFIEEQLLGEWATDIEQEMYGKAEYKLEIARAVADLLAESGDSFTSDTVTILEQAVNVRRESLFSLAAAHRDHIKGRQLYKSGNYAAAESYFLSARSAFAVAGSPFELRSAYALACAQSYQAKYQEALESITSIEKAARAHRYWALRGESLWMMGIAQFQVGRPSLASQHFITSIDQFIAIGESDNVAAVQSLLAELFEFQGDSEAAWKYRYEALKRISKTRDPLRLYQIYFASGVAALNQGKPAIGMYFQEESVRYSRMINNPAAVCSALFWSARYHTKMGLKSRAEEELEEGFKRSAELREGIGDRIKADLLLAKAEILQDTNPRKAKSLLLEALAFSLRAKHIYNLVEVYLSLARANVREGDSPVAENYFEAAISSLEDWRARLGEPAQMLSFSDSKRSAFEEAILFQITRGRFDLAFQYLERWRSQVVRDALLELPLGLPDKESKLRSAPLPLRAEGLYQVLPEGTMFVSYSCLRGSLYVWLVDNSGLKIGQNLGAWADIKRVSDEYRLEVSSVRGESSRRDDPSRDLHQYLFSPIANLVSEGATLVISLDENLSSVSFSALRNPNTGRYLIEDHALVYSSSIAGYVASLREYERRRVRDPSIALFVNPRSQGAVTAFSSLNAARLEGEAIGRLYKNAHSYLEEAATADEFLDEAFSFDIIHYAGHAVFNNHAPLWSYLAFAPSNVRKDGRLYAHELYKKRETIPYLVFLSACGSANVSSRAELGARNLAEALLAAGVPLVVGTVWNVEDSEASEFMVRLHEELGKAIYPWDALREVQVHFIRNPEEGEAGGLRWSPYSLFAGSL